MTDIDATLAEQVHRLHAETTRAIASLRGSIENAIALHELIRTRRSWHDDLWVQFAHSVLEARPARPEPRPFGAGLTAARWPFS